MSSITLTELYSLLTEKVGKETAQSLTSYIEQKIDKEVEHSTRHLASKEDLARGLADTKTDMIKWFVGLFFALAMMVIGLYFK